MSTATRERPILFGGPMVRAILDARKTQTRRPVTEPIDFIGAGGDKGEDWNSPAYWGIADECGDHFTLAPNGEDSYARDYTLRSPFGDAGDRLWVRETFYPDSLPGFANVPPHVHYRADRRGVITKSFDGHWRPSIHMPRWASRITLEITEVRAERLQEISIEDVLAEGISEVTDGPHANQYWREETGAKFTNSWDRIYGKKYSWASNPWVRVISFKPITPTETDAP